MAPWDDDGRHATIQGAALRDAVRRASGQNLDLRAILAHEPWGFTVHRDDEDASCSLIIGRAGCGGAHGFQAWCWGVICYLYFTVKLVNGSEIQIKDECEL
jgi:hypothetical protein